MNIVLLLCLPKLVAINMKYNKINCELCYELFYADISLPNCMGADHTMFIVLYNIMSFTYASKNWCWHEWGLHNNQQDKHASVSALTLNNQKCWIYTTARKCRAAINNSVLWRSFNLTTLFSEWACRRSESESLRKVSPPKWCERCSKLKESNIIY